MKTLIFTICILHLPTFLFGQLFPLQKRVDSLHFKVIEKNNQLALDFSTSTNNGKFPIITNLELTDADLVLHFKFEGKNKKFSKEAIKIVSIIYNNTQTIVPQDREIEEKAQSVSTQKGMEGQRIWLDAGETILNFGESYTLVIERSILDFVDCEKGRPTFELKQQLPYYGGGVAAIASIGLGQFYQVQRNKARSRYHKHWLEGNLSAEAQSDFDEAEIHQRNAKAFTYIGWGLLVTDATLFFLRKRKIKQKQKIFDKYCKGLTDSTLHFTPYFETPIQSSENNISFAGLQLVWQF